jgi:hypothetical protein
MTPGEMRAQLKHDLETGSDGAAAIIGVTVHDVYPDRVAPPCAILGLEPGQYILGGQSFGTYEQKCVVVVLVQRSATALSELESLILKVLVNTADWGMFGVDIPSVFSENGIELLGTTIHLGKQAKLEV